MWTHLVSTYLDIGTSLPDACRRMVGRSGNESRHIACLLLELKPAASSGDLDVLSHFPELSPVEANLEGGSKASLSATTQFKPAQLPHRTPRNPTKLSMTRPGISQIRGL